MKTSSSGEVTVRAEWNTGSPQVLICLCLRSRNLALLLSLAMKLQIYLWSTPSPIYFAVTLAINEHKLMQEIKSSRYWKHPDVDMGIIELPR